MLRPIIATDAHFITAAMQDRQVWEWLSSIPQPFTLTDAMEFIDEIAPGNSWLVTMAEEPQGVIGGKELGYWLVARAWGRGIATEAGRAVVDWRFQRGDRDLITSHFTENLRSKRALEKLGFVDSGPMTASRKGDGRENIPARRMRLTREQWMSRPS